MAKKKAQKKADKKSLPRGKPRARGPRSRTLPGMAQVRDQSLDNLCESLGDVREVMNFAKTEERGLIASALQRMVAKGVQVYKHAGIELARTPGVEQLRVRVIKEQGDADVDDLKPPDGLDEDATSDNEAAEAE